jgi:dTDP-4-amino-4,6-dideoxygalactose transaminase
MSDINASIGRAQLLRVRELLDQRERNFSALQARLVSMRDIRVIDSASSDQANSHYCLSVVLEGPLAGRRDTVIANLHDSGIGTSIYYPHPIPRLSYYVQKYGYDLSRVPNATTISDCSIALPVGPHLDEDDMDRVATEFTRAVGAKS